MWSAELQQIPRDYKTIFMEAVISEAVAALGALHVPTHDQSLPCGIVGDGVLPLDAPSNEPLSHHPKLTCFLGGRQQGEQVDQLGTETLEDARVLEAWLDEHQHRRSTREQVVNASFVCPFDDHRVCRYDNSEISAVELGILMLRVGGELVGCYDQRNSGGVAKFRV